MIHDVWYILTQIWLSSWCHYPGLQRKFWTSGHPWQSCPVFDSHPTRRQWPTWGVPMAWKNLLVDTKISIYVIFVVGVKKSLFMSVWYLSYQLVPSCFRPPSHYPKVHENLECPPFTQNFWTGSPMGTPMVCALVIACPPPASSLSLEFPFAPGDYECWDHNRR